jgi:hypothetical protein
MKRALITIAAIGILAPAAWVAGANAQYMGSPPSPGYGPSPAYGPSQGYDQSQRSTRRAYRRSARQPSGPGGGLVYTPGSGPPPYDVPRQATAQGPWEWHAGPGPSRRGSMCVKHTDAGRGYGYQEPCPPPKKTAGR